MLKAVHAQEDRAAALRKAHDVHKKLLAMRLTKAVQTHAKEGVEETLAYMSFPPGALDQDPHDQSPGAYQPGDPAPNSRGGRLPPTETPRHTVAAGLRHIAGFRWSAKLYK